MTTTREQTAEQRKALGGFLANKRASLQPKELGLSDEPRRTHGLRREEVAALAGVSVSWYTWLEQGRDIRASADTLRRIAQVLRLNRVESTHLFALSSRERPVFASDERVTDGLTPLVEAVRDIPTIIRNGRFDVLAWNEAAAKLFVEYSTLLPQERNTLRLLFAHRQYRSLFLDWERVARGTLSVFRAARAKAQDRARFDGLAEELSAASPEFRRWWPEVDVEGFDEGRERLRHPSLGRVDLTYIALAPEGRPDLTITAYIPHWIAAGAGTDPRDLPLRRLSGTSVG